MQPLPPNADLETKPVLRKAASAHRFLAELKGLAATIPNENILIDTLSLQEARESSAIENIITTYDEIYRTDLFSGQFASPAAKEVHRYATALKTGFRLIRNHAILSNSHVLEIQGNIEMNNAGYRRLPGTKLLNDRTGEVVYVPPQEYDAIVSLMQNLLQFINDDEMMDVDPLIKMALIHHQFESIHPFYDGNGRTGRILNILFLIQKGLLDLPILYLSRYIIARKSDYYRLLQHVRNTGEWEDWIIFMLDAVENTARESIALIQNIKILMQEFKQTLRTRLPKIYSQDLLNNLFRHPYTKIDFIRQDLNVNRLTATNYLNRIVEIGLLEKQKIGRDNYYINTRLFKLLSNLPGKD